MLAHSPISAFPISAIGFPPIKGAIQAAVKLQQTYRADPSASETMKANAKQLP